MMHKDTAKQTETEKVFPAYIVAVDSIVENERGEILIARHARGHWAIPGVRSRTVKR
jgi:hypothetical protein